MKKTLLFLILTSVLFSQDVEDGAVDEVPPSVTLSEESPPPTKKNSIEQRNWIFAAGAAVAAAAAIVVVWINPGDSPSSNNSH
jgi:hypothetical protein